MIATTKFLLCHVANCAIAERLLKVFTDNVRYFQGHQAKTSLVIQILVHILQMLECLLFPQGICSLFQSAQIAQKLPQMLMPTQFLYVLDSP